MKNDLSKDIWALIIKNKKQYIENYISNMEDIVSSMKNIKQNISHILREKENKNNEKSEMERNLTSIKPTIENINNLLNLYGFKNFYLKITDETNTYTIVRPNGTNAIDTLSEGEKSFVSFLYFYFLIKGGIHENTINKEKIIVIDDPVSSMDFNTSFIISSLVKEIIDQVCNYYYDKNPNKIKQVFLISHNAYFFKEVTYHRNKRKTFWTITKKEIFHPL